MCWRLEKRGAGLRGMPFSRLMPAKRAYKERADRDSLEGLASTGARVEECDASTDPVTSPKWLDAVSNCDEQ
jgi:hypothetical protein